MYYWIWAISNEGKLAVFSPPYLTEEEASNYGFQHFGSNFNVKESKSRDRAEVTKSIKREVFEMTNNLDMALKRANHKIPNEG